MTSFLGNVTNYFLGINNEKMSAEEAVLMLPLVKSLHHAEVPLAIDEYKTGLVATIAKEYMLAK